jgi:hypothetical protein
MLDAPVTAQSKAAPPSNRLRRRRKEEVDD